MPSSHELRLQVRFGTQVVGIDEAQFFDEGLIAVCNDLAFLGVRVIVAGLDMDFRGEPFGPVPGLMAIAEYVDKVHAICVRCGAPATYSQRIAGGSEQVHGRRRRILRSPLPPLLPARRGFADQPRAGIGIQDSPPTPLSADGKGEPMGFPQTPSHLRILTPAESSWMSLRATTVG